MKTKHRRCSLFRKSRSRKLGNKNVDLPKKVDEVVHLYFIINRLRKEDETELKINIILYLTPFFISIMFLYI